MFVLLLSEGKSTVTRVQASKYVWSTPPPQRLPTVPGDDKGPHSFAGFAFGWDMCPHGLLLLMVQKSQTTTWDVQNPANSGIIHLLIGALVSSINSMVPYAVFCKKTHLLGFPVACSPKETSKRKPRTKKQTWHLMDSELVDGRSSFPKMFGSEAQPQPGQELGQWLNFKLFGITYLVGKIKFKVFFQGPLAE